MKRITRYMLVLSTMMLVGTAWAGQDKASDAPQKLTLALDLDDGSHVIGVPGIESIPVQTSYAKMDIQLNEILTIRIEEDHEKASIDLRNGDKLKGVINLEPIKLETIFGTVKIGIEHIRKIDVVLSGGVLLDELRKGLVLYYAFDRDEGGNVPDKSGNGNNATVRGAKYIAGGKRGGAYEFDGSHDVIEGSKENTLPTGGSPKTISVWVKPEAVGGIILKHGNDSHVTSEGFSFNINGDWTLWLAGYNVDLVSKGAMIPNAWNHLCVTYESSKASIFINGRLDTSGGFSQSIPAHTNLQIGHNVLSGDSSYFDGAIDEVMIFNRALSQDEVKQLYDAQR